MPAPPFEARPEYPYKVLPDGVFPLSTSELETVFVKEFPGSKTRPLIMQGFFSLRTEAEQQGIVATQWVDGSFVESKKDPGDVDVVTFCDYDFISGLPQPVQIFLQEKLSAGTKTKPVYLTHTVMLVPSCPQGHPFFPVFEQWRLYWRKWLGRTYDKNDPRGDEQPRHKKGFCSLTLGESSKAPTIEVGGNTP